MRSTKSEHRPKPKPGKGQSRQTSFEAIGTHWVIDIYEPVDDIFWQHVQTDIASLIEIFDKNYSRFRPDSLVTQMAKRAGDYALPADAERLLDFYKSMYEVSGGLVTPLIGQSLADAGYDANYSLHVKNQLAEVPKWHDVLDYDYPKLKLKQPALLDFGAAGKGYLVDLVAEYLVAEGMHAFCVDAGGDMRHHGSETLRVGLENPSDSGQVIGVLNLRVKSLCGSAGNRRAWGQYHHILDPKKLTSPGHIAAVWVLAGSTMLADGLATCLFFVDANTLLNHYTFEYVLVRADFTLEQSANFPAEFFFREG